MSSKKSVVLVLGSGSSRGWAHIGAIEALEEEKIPINYIVGCSIIIFYFQQALSLWISFVDLFGFEIFLKEISKFF